MDGSRATVFGNLASQLSNELYQHDQPFRYALSYSVVE